MGAVISVLGAVFSIVETIISIVEVVFGVAEMVQARFFILISPKMSTSVAQKAVKTAFCVNKKKNNNKDVPPELSNRRRKVPNIRPQLLDGVKDSCSGYGDKWEIDVGGHLVFSGIIVA